MPLETGAQLAWTPADFWKRFGKSAENSVDANASRDWRRFFPISSRLIGSPTLEIAKFAI